MRWGIPVGGAHKPVWWDALNPRCRQLMDGVTAAVQRGDVIHYNKGKRTDTWAQWFSDGSVEIGLNTVGLGIAAVGAGVISAPLSLPVATAVGTVAGSRILEIVGTAIADFRRQMVEFDRLARNRTNHYLSHHPVRPCSDTTCCSGSVVTALQHMGRYFDQDVAKRFPPPTQIRMGQDALPSARAT